MSPQSLRLNHVICWQFSDNKFNSICPCSIFKIILYIAYRCIPSVLQRLRFYFCMYQFNRKIWGFFFFFFLKIEYIPSPSLSVRLFETLTLSCLSYYSSNSFQNALYSRMLNFCWNIVKLLYIDQGAQKLPEIKV